MKKPLMIAAAALTIVGAGAISATSTFAQGSGDYTSSLVEKIAEKFGLDKNEVQAVFDQERKERQTTKEAEYTAKLDALVKDGTLTEEQKRLILEKREEMKNDRESIMQRMHDMTTYERRTAIDEKRQKIKQWAEEHDIDPQHLMFFGKGMRGHPNAL